MTRGAAEVEAQGVMTDMVQRVLVDKLTPEKAVEEATDRMKAIYARYPHLHKRENLGIVADNVRKAYSKDSLAKFAARRPGSLAPPPAGQHDCR